MLPLLPHPALSPPTYLPMLAGESRGSTCETESVSNIREGGGGGVVVMG